MKLTPYWWEAAPPEALPEAAPPAKADVVVIGAGYSGLSAALRLVSAGRSVVVLEAEAMGLGASTRNGGQASGTLKVGLGALTARYGLDQAKRLAGEGIAALDHLEALIAREDISCDFERCGRFTGAWARKDFDHLVGEARLLSEHLGIETEVVARAEQGREIGSAVYWGGVLRKDLAALHPGLLHKGLVSAVTRAGAVLLDRTPAVGLELDGARKRVATPRGAIEARDILVATNGYTGSLTPWLRRRLIPIQSQIIATAPLDPAVMARLMPRGRTVVDTRRLHNYYRPSPDGRRILFGGRADGHEDDPRRSGRHLYANMVELFPELDGVEITHAWSGTTGYTFDSLAHVGKCGGERDGLHYAIGFCGGGVSWAPYLGDKAACRMLGLPEGETAFGNRRFTTRPLYSGRPWFLPTVLVYYRLRDRLARLE